MKTTKLKDFDTTKPFRKQEPHVLITKLLYIEIIKNLGAEKVKDLNTQLVNEYEDEEGKTIYELDYEYMLFSAPDYQFEKAFKKLEIESTKEFKEIFGVKITKKDFEDVGIIDKNIITRPTPLIL